MSVTLNEAQQNAIKFQLDNAQAALIAAYGIISQGTVSAKAPPTSPPAQPQAIAGDAKDAWRLEPASEKQLALLEKNKIPPRAGLTKGEASDLIDKLFKERK